MKPREAVALTKTIIDGHLNEIRTLFDAETVHLTLVVRIPAYSDGSADLVATGDNLDDVIRALEQAKRRRMT